MQEEEDGEQIETEGGSSSRARTSSQSGVGQPYEARLWLAGRYRVIVHQLTQGHDCLVVPYS